MSPLEQLLHTLIDSLKEHAVKILTGLVLMGAGWFIGFRRARASWRKREFFDRLNVSLTYLEEGTLVIRTLSEKPCADVFLNSAASDAVQQAARRTTAADPILPLPKDDYWYYLNAVLNDLSEQFAAGALRREQGHPARGEWYLVCLTSEAAGELRMRKVRAMVVRKSLLANLVMDSPAADATAVAATSPLSTPKFSSPHHVTRWETLKFLAVEAQRQPWRFLEVELCT